MQRHAHRRPLHAHRRVHGVHVQGPDPGPRPDHGPLGHPGAEVRRDLHRLPRLVRADRHRPRALRPLREGLPQVRRPGDGRLREAVSRVLARLPQGHEEALREGGRRHAQHHRGVHDARQAVRPRPVRQRLDRGSPQGDGRHGPPQGRPDRRVLRRQGPGGRHLRRGRRPRVLLVRPGRRGILPRDRRRVRIRRGRMRHVRPPAVQGGGDRRGLHAEEHRPHPRRGHGRALRGRLRGRHPQAHQGHRTRRK